MADHVMQEILALLAEGKNLRHDLAVRAFQIIMNGGATPAQMGAFLMGLRVKGETIDEICAGAEALRAKAVAIKCPPGAIDTCGTGGDNKGTYNVSTAVAFVVAACGVPVAKHGNRSVSSRSGSSDVLTALGIKVDPEVQLLERCLTELGICFMMAPKFHPATRHIAPVRQELGTRTIFNMLGPVSNPAHPDFHLMGIYDGNLIEPMANVLKALGVKAAWVVHGSDGLDEMTLTGPSKVAQLKDDKVTTFTVTPEDAGLTPASLEELKGGTPEENAKALQHAISGADSAYRRAVLLNAAGALVVSGKAGDLKAGVAMAAEAIDSGKAHHILMKLAELTHAYV